MQGRLDEGAWSEPCNADYFHTGDVSAPSAPLLLCIEDEFREQSVRTWQSAEIGHQTQDFKGFMANPGLFGPGEHNDLKQLYSISLSVGNK